MLAVVERSALKLARRIAQLFGTRPRLLASPVIVSSQIVCDALLDDPQISDTLVLAARADVALVGVGRPTSGSVVLKVGILTEEELEQLHACGAVGNIILRIFDANGQAVNDFGRPEGIFTSNSTKQSAYVSTCLALFVLNQSPCFFYCITY